MELGNSRMHTLMDAPDAKVYPSLHLNDGDSNAVPDPTPGDERLFTGKVRITSVSMAKNGERSVVLEVLEMSVDPKEKPSVAERAYPTMVKG